MAGITVVWLPEVRVTRELARWHSGVRQRLSPGKTCLPVGQDPVILLTEGQDRVRAHMVKTGYSYLDDAHGVYRPTWKGAVRMTWRLIWPVRPLFRAWLRR